MMIRRPKPQERPAGCPRCHGPRVWWPSATSPIGYAPACAWCDADAMRDPPDDCDHDADTVLEPREPDPRRPGVA